MKQKEYDKHIIEELKKLPLPLKTFDGHDVLFDKDKRNETIYEHIANKKHHLHVKDIKQIPKILKNENNVKRDRKGSKFRTYIARRDKRKEKFKYLKITTEINKNKNETIITVHPVKNNSWYENVFSLN